uniref:Nucleotide-binding alpha-beta plait domain-containing protein n=1 Tax=Tanacetum cinerariifolium TaxID=118510 RepID=A0A6L2KH22_TANCI|nr:nucleotide-binding alpha-beta plait domain-containing protein [Tanacetum cinerariifolium]
MVTNEKQENNNEWIKVTCKRGGERKDDIAFKKTKRNTRFGFARFVNFGDINDFEDRLKGIMIGNTNLYINRAKFNKGEKRGFLDADSSILTIYESTLIWVIEVRSGMSLQV